MIGTYRDVFFFFQAEDGIRDSVLRALDERGSERDPPFRYGVTQEIDARLALEFGAFAFFGQEADSLGLLQIDINTHLTRSLVEGVHPATQFRVVVRPYQRIVSESDKANT